MDADVRLKQLLGEENVQKISALKVAVIGLGGVGGYAVETLARSFVGTLYLVDFDVVDMSNINRQIIALHSTVGKKKSFLWKERILDINPGCDVRIIDCFLEKENMDVLFSHSIDYVVDACDTLETKMELIRFCEQKKLN